MTYRYYKLIWIILLLPYNIEVGIDGADIVHYYDKYNNCVVVMIDRRYHKYLDVKEGIEIDEIKSRFKVNHY